MFLQLAALLAWALVQPSRCFQHSLLSYTRIARTYSHSILDASATAAARTVGFERSPHCAPHADSIANIDDFDGITSRGLRTVSVVESLLDHLYPPADASQRNALSRTDGYWPYIQHGEEPPLALTYGEFDVKSLAHILDQVKLLQQTHDCGNYKCSRDNQIFTDLGSGTGRMVLAAAALDPDWRLCRGIELLPRLHETAVAVAQERDCTTNAVTADSQTTTQTSRQAPVQLVCGSMMDIDFSDSDVVFCFSTCMADIMESVVGAAIIRQCRPGTIVVTTDYVVPQLAPPLHTEQLWCGLLDSQCTVYYHLVV